MPTHPNLTLSDAETLRGGAIRLRDKLSDFASAYGNWWVPGSQADLELKRFPKPEIVAQAHSFGVNSIQVSADLSLALTKTLADPVQTIAPWACVRSIIESSALACWLLDPRIDVRMRIQRSFAWDYEQLDQQMKYGRSTKQPINRAEAIMDQVENDAIALGYEKVVDKNGKRGGIGQRMPTFSDIVKLVFQSDSSYRLCSAFVHGQTWALIGLSQRPAPEHSLSPEKDLKQGVVHFVNDIIPNNIALLLQLAGSVFATPVWYQSRLFGWDCGRLRSILQLWAENIKLPNEMRFWIE